jgi:hypothetical protein
MVKMSLQILNRKSADFVPIRRFLTISEDTSNLVVILSTDWKQIYRLGKNLQMVR